MNPVETLETAKATNPLKDLLKFGQSVWLDYIRRDLMTSGELKRLIEEDGLRGMTSNPAIFEKAISDSNLYDDILKSLSGKNLTPTAKFEALAIRDIQDAADGLRPVFDASKGQDGFVSLEVSPLLARDTKGTIEEARRLHKAVARPNVMIKVPGTVEGLPAFQQLTAEGININVTLLFSQQMYEQIAEAYVAGLEQFAANGGDVSKMASVASFFISRIDSAIEKAVETKLKTTSDPAQQTALKTCWGKSRSPTANSHIRATSNFRDGPLEEACCQGRTFAARSLGQHQHQKSGVSRCHVHRRVNWARHGQHHSSGNAGRLSRSRHIRG